MRYCQVNHTIAFEAAGVALGNQAKALVDYFEGVFDANEM